MKFDYYLPPSGIGDAVAKTAWAQARGFDGVFSADTAHEPFLPLAAAMQAVPEMDYGTAIAVAFARSPMVVAQTAWDLASLSGGRFMLGLGSQIRPHIVRRFSMPWDSPGPRMREYLAAVRAIWNTFQHGTALSFQGDFYQFSLMTPFFNAGPIDTPDVPIYLAGVGPYMTKLAGEVADGLHAHPFHTVRYLDEVVQPAIDAGAALAGRTACVVERVCPIMVITGHSEEQISDAREAVRQQIAFYASTPAYRSILDLHDWDFGERLTALSKRGDWDALAGVIPDEVVEAVAVVAPVAELGAALRERYSGRLDRIGLYTLGGDGFVLSDEDWTTIAGQARGD